MFAIDPIAILIRRLGSIPNDLDKLKYYDKLSEQNLREWQNKYKSSLETKDIDLLEQFDFREVCELIKPAMDSNISHKDLSQLSSWSEIKRIQKIRNVIVHQAGELKEKDEFWKYVNSSNNLKIDNNHFLNKIILSESYFSEVIDCYFEFFSRLSEMVKLKFE